MNLVKRMPLIIALLSIAALAAAGLGVRFNWWNYRQGFQFLEWSAYAGLAAAAIAIIALAIPKTRRGAVITHIAAIAVGMTTAYLPWQQKQQAQALPKIHDISTDLANPPQFEKMLPLRAGAPNSAIYGGTVIAEAQRAGYPDIQPKELPLAPGDAYARAFAAAKEMNWEIVNADAGTGLIEATATTLWFGFKDDVVIRVTPTQAGGSRIDVRSVSRVGKSDVGANAARIRKYFAKLAAI